MGGENKTRGAAGASAATSASREALKDLVRFLQRFLAPDIKPGPFDLVSFHRLPRVEPLDKSSGLVRIISRGEIGREKRHYVP
jgi:hypothetical protein